ncbi:MAG: glucose-6-phosphate isomerase [Bacteroidales bacterium]|nr:glucose-6-phosphate isomerase [Bacteroidales bacterium]
MKNIVLDITKTSDFIQENEIEEMQKAVSQHHSSLIHKTGKGNDFLGWVDLPSSQPEYIYEDIEKYSRYFIENCEAVVVVGIGGSYLGARAVIEALKSYFGEKKGTEIVYAGHHMDAEYLAELTSWLDNKEYGIIVISKSGTTTEPAIAFRILKRHIEKKYGKNDAPKRIIAITDKERGALKALANSEGYPTFIINDNVGGRYSVLTPVGLLPVAMAGFNIRNIISGAAKAEMELKERDSVFENPANLYAAIRNIFYRKGKLVELLVAYQPRFFYLAEWWKQLFGESEGKENKGIFPAGAGFTTDLHSLGQYIQEGERFLFETCISVGSLSKNLTIPGDNQNLDGLNYISGKSIHEINKTAGQGTSLAHVSGGVPVISINVPEINEEYLGWLLYFFEFSCAMSGYLLEVNPFDQPGVEAYKKNMFALLGKSGYEDLTRELRKKL